MLKRSYAMFKSRNREYFRDRAAFGWNFAFPFMIIVAFFFIFQRGGQTPYQCGVIVPAGGMVEAVENILPEAVLNIEFIEWIPVTDKNQGLDSVRRHRMDLLIDPAAVPYQYWISETSPKGKIAESLILSALYEPAQQAKITTRQTVGGIRIDYIDWLFPGVLAMNMMFSALFGVGYVIVRYRKAGVLKRLKATPLKPFEYLAAQVVSRLFVVMFSNIILFAGCALLFDFHCKGSLLDLFVFFTIGTTCIISIGLIVAARSSSEEFANGVLTVITWPMMFFSEVWFSLEGTSPWVQKFSMLFPLKHVTAGMRKIITEGAGWTDLGLETIVLLGLTVFFIAVGSLLFKWTED